MKVYHNVGYAPNPGRDKRNQMPYLKEKDGPNKGKSNIPESPIGRGRNNTPQTFEIKNNKTFAIFKLPANTNNLL